MRRDSWRSVPMMCRPPAATTSLCSFCHDSRTSATRRSFSESGERLVGLQRLDLGIGIAAQHDVGAAAGHVGGDGDLRRAPGLGHDLGLARVLLGVQHVVRDLLPLQHRREAAPSSRPTSCRRGSAGPWRVRSFTSLRIAWYFSFAVMKTWSFRSLRTIGRCVGMSDRLEVVDRRELEGLRVRRARHARELLVEAEVVLERDRGERLALVLDRDAFLGLHRLVQAVGPAPALHHAAGELVDDHHLVVLHHVVLVAVVERVRADARVQVVHQHDVRRVVEARALGEQPRARHDLLGVLVARSESVTVCCFRSTQ